MTAPIQPAGTLEAAIEPHHFAVAESLVRACQSLGLGLHDTALTLIAALDLVADNATEPGKAIENFIAILAQLQPDRGPLAKLVLDYVADLMEREGAKPR